MTKITIHYVQDNPLFHLVDPSGFCFGAYVLVQAEAENLELAFENCKNFLEKGIPGTHGGYLRYKYPHGCEYFFSTEKRPHVDRFSPEMVAKKQEWNTYYSITQFVESQKASVVIQDNQLL